MAGSIISAAVLVTSTSVVKNSMTRLIPSLQEAVTWCKTLSSTVSLLQDRNISGSLETLHALVKSERFSTVHDEPILIALGNLRATVDLMNTEMSKINDKVNEHKQKYLASWRSIGFDAEVNQLAKLEPLMTLQFEYLVKVSSICASAAILSASPFASSSASASGHAMEHKKAGACSAAHLGGSHPRVVSCSVFEVPLQAYNKDEQEDMCPQVLLLEQHQHQHKPADKYVKM
jgi:hypothetical protein